MRVCVSDLFHGDITYNATTLDASLTRRGTLCTTAPSLEICVLSRLNTARCLAHAAALRYRFVPISFVYLLSIKFTEYNDVKRDTVHDHATALRGH